MKVLFKYALKYKIDFIIRLITKVFVVLSILSFDFMMGIIVDVFSTGQTEKFVPIIISTIILIIVMFVSEYIDGIVMSNYIKKTVNNLRCDIFYKIMKKDIKDFSIDNSGRYMSILYNDVKLIEDNFLNNIFTIISYFISFTISVIVLFNISYIIVIFIVIFSILGFIIPNALSKKLIKEKTKYSQELENITSTTKDLFTGFEVIKGFNITNKVRDIFNDSSTKVETSKQRFSIIEAIIRGFSISFGTSIYLGVLILGGYLMHKGEITVGTAIIIIQLSTHVVSPIKNSITLINQMKSVSSIGNKIEEILNINNIDNENVELKDFKSSIEIKNLSYSYTPHKKALKDINLSFEKNKKYAIVGESGCGKSTLIKLIMRYYNDYQGNISIDNKNLNNIYSLDLYKMMSIIQQNVFMFDDSIKENIRLFSDIDDEKILSACEKSNLSNLINSLEDGINARVGENGNRLSGGEKQRIAIARALVNDTKILILDESTSALDNETAYNLEKSLLQVDDLTMIVVTHKLIKNILINYDEIIVMKDGNIIEKGSFESLINKKGYFYSLYYIQSDDN